MKITITKIKKIALLQRELMLEARSNSVSCVKTSIRVHLLDIKVVTVFSILYRLVYYNNSGYLLLFISFYLYVVKAKNDIIVF